MPQPTPPPEDEFALLLKDPHARAWFEEHLADLRMNAFEQRFRYMVLAATFAVGFVLYVAGYLLKAAATTEPLGLLTDLIYTFGFALWTGAVIVVLLEVVPAVKRRQIRRALAVYEATRGEKAIDRSSTHPGSPDAPA